MKRIAVCLSGQSRTFRTASKKLKEFLKEYYVDYYLHTWTDNSYGCCDHRSWSVSDTLEEELQEIYKPKKLIIEDREKVPLLNPDRVNARFESTAYSFSTSLGLYLQQKEEYDLVIWTRFDIVPGIDKTFQYLEDLKPFEVRSPGYGASSNKLPMHWQTGTTIWDMILIMEPRAVPIMHEYFSWMVQQPYGQWTYFPTNKAGQGREIFIEAAFFKFCAEKDLPVGTILPDYQFRIVRSGQEDWTQHQREQFQDRKEEEQWIHDYVQSRIDSDIREGNKSTKLI